MHNPYLHNKSLSYSSFHITVEWRCFDIEDEEEKRKKDFKSVQEGYSLSATTQNDPDQQPER